MRAFATLAACLSKRFLAPAIRCGRNRLPLSRRFSSFESRCRRKNLPAIVRVVLLYLHQGKALPVGFHFKILSSPRLSFDCTGRRQCFLSRPSCAGLCEYRQPTTGECGCQCGRRKNEFERPRQLRSPLAFARPQYDVSRPRRGQHGFASSGGITVSEALNIPGNFELDKLPLRAS